MYWMIVLNKMTVKKNEDDELIRYQSLNFLNSLILLFSVFYFDLAYTFTAHQGKSSIDLCRLLRKQFAIYSLALFYLPIFASYLH